MFGDIGWSELLLISIVALIVIGPEDLPQMFRQVGRFTAKMRAMSRDFSRAMDQAAKESGVKDVTDTVKGATSATSMGLSKVKAAADRFEKWDPIKPSPPAAAAKPIVVPPVAAAVSSAGVEPTIHSAETKALLNKQVARKAAVLPTAAPPEPISAPPAQTSKAKPARAKPVEIPATAKVVSKPRVAKKPKKADEA